MVKVTFSQHLAILYLLQYLDRYRGSKVSNLHQIDADARYQLEKFVVEMKNYWPQEAAEIAKLTVKLSIDSGKLLLTPYVDGLEVCVP